jgi:CheY-like chemotaxis protein
MDVANMLGKLLIAEDEDTLSYFLRQSLEDSTPSFRVEVVGAGDEALKKVVAGHFDLIVVDLRLPDRRKSESSGSTGLSPSPLWSRT